MPVKPRKNFEVVKRQRHGTSRAGNSMMRRTHSKWLFGWRARVSPLSLRKRGSHRRCRLSIARCGDLDSQPDQPTCNELTADGETARCERLVVRSSIGHGELFGRTRQRPTNFQNDRLDFC